MKQILLLFVALLPYFTSAQKKEIPRDTSFTVYSSLIKEQKKYPAIKIAKPSPLKGVTAKENITYRQLTDRSLSLDIFYPSRENRRGYPGVVMIHGGGWRSGDRSQCVPIAQQLAANGYVAVAVEYRLSLEAQYPAGIHDVKAAIRWMRANAKMYSLDTARIAVMGFSSGGQMAALVGTTSGDATLEGDKKKNEPSSRVQAVIDVDGILAFKHPESAEGMVASQWLGGTYEEKPEVWNDASALHRVDKNSVPILFINSSLPRFHAGRDDMRKKLDDFKIYSEVHELPDTPHPFWLFHPWFTPTVDFTIKFLNLEFKERDRSTHH
jgi:acetyl esterase/lipase